MHHIYQTQYQVETLAEANEAAEANVSCIEQAIFASLTSFPNELLLLSRLCNQLAAHEDASIEISFDEAENVATILLSAPCFVFQAHQLMLLQKISLFASELLFDTTEEESSQLCISLDFSHPQELLYRQMEHKFQEQ